MVKKISAAEQICNNIQKAVSKMKKNKKVKYDIPEQKPDTFETALPQADKAQSDMANLEFKYKKLEFYPEDVEKMKDMSVQEKIKFVRQLKKEKRFIVPKD